MACNTILSNPQILDAIIAAVPSAGSSPAYTWGTMATASTVNLGVDNSNNAYYCWGTDYTGVFNLPPTGVLGQTYFFIDDISAGTGGYGKVEIAQNADQQISSGTVSTTVGTGGGILCNHQGTAFSLICINSYLWYLVPSPSTFDVSVSDCFDLY